MPAVILKDWGWNTRFARELQQLPAGLLPGRIISDAHGVLRALSPLGEVEAQLKGRLRLLKSHERPVVGDWVALEQFETDFLVEAVLDRQTQITRQAAGKRTEAQVLAANVDLIFVISSLDQEFSRRRLERYLVTAWESGAEPVVLLSKLDLCESPAEFIDAAREVSPGVTVIAYSTVSGIGLAPIRREIQTDTTVVLLGSSGVGKSTLVNTLLGKTQLKTQEVRATDQKGRHTTSHRELVRIPSGGLLIDTPGLRELQLWGGEVGLDQAFPELEEFAQHCRFRDCTHEQEPDCAVIAAVENGGLSKDRYDSYLKLRREAAFQRQRRSISAALAEKKRSRSQQKHLRKRIQEKGRG